MRRFLPFIIILLAAATAVTGGSLLYRAKKADLAVTPAVSSENFGSTPGAIPSHLRGDVKAKITIEEFGDFQCPPCATLSSGLAKLEHDYGDKLRVIFRQYPLPMHNHAMEAAQAAEAAGAQGHFWEMHDLLYKNQIAWSKEPDVAPVFAEYAKSLRLDLERFREDLRNPKLTARISADQKRADALGVKSTPTLFLNDQLVPPASFNEVAVRAAIDALLRGEKPNLPAPTPRPAPSISPQP